MTSHVLQTLTLRKSHDRHNTVLTCRTPRYRRGRTSNIRIGIIVDDYWIRSHRQQFQLIPLQRNESKFVTWHHQFYWRHGGLWHFLSAIQRSTCACTLSLSSLPICRYGVTTERRRCYSLYRNVLRPGNNPLIYEERRDVATIGPGASIRNPQ